MPLQNQPQAPSESLQQRLAEAAHYAVSQRIAPVLRHDVAGPVQPIGMMTKVLQRRLQAPVPDLLEISKNLASVSALKLHTLSGDQPSVSNVPDSADSAGARRQARSIEWCDVQALAHAFHVTMTRGEGWLKLGLPQAA